MRRSKTTSLEEVRLAGRFERLREALLAESYAGHREKPLAFWALPTDRRLPRAFLDRKLADLLGTPFEELAAIQGIGPKKIESFVHLLDRAARTDLPKSVNGNAARENGKPRISPTGASNGFDPDTISEVVWARWCNTVVERGLGREPLGRFAPTLRNMTRVIWNTPLETYTNLSLAEIRAMRAYGRKRIRATLEVFYILHKLIAQMGRHREFVVRIVPRRIDAVERCVGRWLQTPGVPAEEEILHALVRPLLEQLDVDASPQIVQLAQQRLAVNGPMASVRQVARSMGLTRARVYQLLNEINDIVTVRWPMGRHQVHQLREKFEVEVGRMKHRPKLDQFLAAVELFYPTTRRGAAGSVERSNSKGEALAPRTACRKNVQH